MAVYTNIYLDMRQAEIRGVHERESRDLWVDFLSLRHNEVLGVEEVPVELMALEREEIQSWPLTILVKESADVDVVLFGIEGFSISHNT